MKNGKGKNTGQKYWRSLNDLAKTPEFKERLAHEFPGGLNDIPQRTISRRGFLGLMSGTLAMAGLAGCRKPIEKIVPYVNPPEEVIPGIANFYATNMPFKTSAFGLIAEAHEGRPTKLEGNKEHPASLGAANLYMQASVMDLYNPDRLQKVIHDGVEKDWDQFVTAWRDLREKYLQNRGKGLAIISESFSSLTASRLLEQFSRSFPEAKTAAWEASELTAPDNIVEIDGRDYRRMYRLRKAKVILTLEYDLFSANPEMVTNASGFSSGRRLRKPQDSMNRLYSVESNYTLTGAMADHRLKLSAGLIPGFLLALTAELSKMGVLIDLPAEFKNYTGKFEFDQKWLSAVADDLAANRGKSLIAAGSALGKDVLQLVQALNEALGNIGETVEFREAEDVFVSDSDAVEEIFAAPDQVETLIIIGGNPAYDTPTNWKVSDAIRKIPNTVHLTNFANDTSVLCNWQINRTHYLEQWGDVRAVDGTAGIIQPLIAPLYDGKAEIELWSLLATGENARGYDIVRETWNDLIRRGNFDKEWNKVLHDGLLVGSEAEIKTPRLSRNEINIINRDSFTEIIPTKESLEINLYLSPALYDGRYAENGWMQELPDPVTKLTWDNAALVNIKTAGELGVKPGEFVRISLEGNELDIPVWIQPGLADFTVAIALGYGRKEGSQTARNVGFNGYRILSDKKYIYHGARITASDKMHTFANTQDHSAMEGRAIVREANLEDYRKNPKFAPEMVEHPPLESIFTEQSYDKGYQWGMTIDLNSCIGCGACTIACQSENNIPVVGKKQVHLGREMHWLRNDRYFVGEPDDPKIVIQPMPCQHCENAPCETVCPVAATVHDKEGINAMVYNRCIGTRYCSNNCPYKVRRFNFFNYTKDYTPTVKMQQNPDVTIRFRGVMEKCTFCIQRINRTKQKAKKEKRTVRDGEILSACQQTCPVNAIQFGNINDKESMVSKSKEIDRNYALLAEFNVKPRNTFLAKIRNPHRNLIPALPEKVEHDDAEH